jgi:hypothetical protein
MLLGDLSLELGDNMTKYYVNSEGSYLGGFDGLEPPEGALEIPKPPDHAGQKWNGEKYIEPAEQIIARLEGALDRHLDAVANQYRYESIRTMVTYATSEHPTFGNEGRAAVKYRDAVYAYGIQCISDVQAELRPIPTEAELIAELPPFTDFLE